MPAACHYRLKGRLKTYVAFKHDKFRTEETSKSFMRTSIFKSAGIEVVQMNLSLSQDPICLFSLRNNATVFRLHDATSRNMDESGYWHQQHHRVIECQHETACLIFIPWDFTVIPYLALFTGHCAR